MVILDSFGVNGASGKLDPPDSDLCIGPVDGNDGDCVTSDLTLNQRCIPRKDVQRCTLNRIEDASRSFDELVAARHLVLRLTECS